MSSRAQGLLTKHWQKTERLLMSSRIWSLPEMRSLIIKLEKFEKRALVCTKRLYFQLKKTFYSEMANTFHVFKLIFHNIIITRHNNWHNYLTMKREKTWLYWKTLLKWRAKRVKLRIIWRKKKKKVQPWKQKTRSLRNSSNSKSYWTWSWNLLSGIWRSNTKKKKRIWKTL